MSEESEPDDLKKAEAAEALENRECPVCGEPMERVDDGETGGERWRPTCDCTDNIELMVGGEPDDVGDTEAGRPDGHLPKSGEDASGNGPAESRAGLSAASEHSGDGPEPAAFLVEQEGAGGISYVQKKEPDYADGEPLFTADQLEKEKQESFVAGQKRERSRMEAVLNDRIECWENQEEEVDGEEHRTVEGAAKLVKKELERLWEEFQADSRTAQELEEELADSFRDIAEGNVSSDIDEIKKKVEEKRRYRKRFKERLITLELTPYEAGQVSSGLRKMEEHWRNSAEEQDLPVHAHRANVCEDVLERLQEKLEEAWAKIDEVVGDGYRDMGVSD